MSNYKVFDSEGNLIEEKDIDLKISLDWTRFNYGFFSDEAYNKIFASLQMGGHVSSIYAARAESLALRKTEDLNIFITCWNRMIQWCPEDIKNLITTDAIATWNAIASAASMPFVYNSQGYIEIT
jgi:hypothetical protein